MAVKGWAVGLPAAALVGTNKLPWEALGNVRELYLCLDLDVTGEGQKAARKLAREAVVRGVPAHIMRTADIPSLPNSGRPRAALPWTGPSWSYARSVRPPSITTTRTTPRIAKPTARGFRLLHRPCSRRPGSPP